MDETVSHTYNDCALGDMPAALLYICHMKNPYQYLILKLKTIYHSSIFLNQSRTNGPINAHLTIAQVMPKYNHNNEKQEALL